MGKTLIFFGIVLIALGTLFILAQKFPWIGRLPGDICIKKENFTFWFPITTSILISIILSVILIFLGKR
ncbi:MAG: DUF2905 domain-containing protein [Candidatus Omnitrophica bacterium]|nr:DUF2905 domain-containing protein [Candidatus Omnitrophota bacterium]